MTLSSRLRRRTALVAAAVTGLAGTLPRVAAASGSKRRGRRPNIVVILADDFGYGALGAYGQQVLKTPHLDRLADEGIRFTNGYSGASVCAPSRTTLGYVASFGSVAVATREAHGRLVWGLYCFEIDSSTSSRESGAGEAVDDREAFERWVRHAANASWQESKRLPVMFPGGDETIDPGQDVRILAERRAPAEAAAYGEQAASYAAHYRFADGREGFTLVFRIEGDGFGALVETIDADELDTPTMAGYLAHLREQQAAQ
jgi:hypothetical protein